MSLETRIEDKQLGHVFPRNHQDLSDSQVSFLNSLDGFEAPYLKEKLLKDGKFASEAEYGEAFGEFKRFMALIGLYGRRVAMTSKPVDEVWHQFILFTREYSDFCDMMLGKYVHHVPRTSFTPLDPKGRQNLIGLYEATYGDMPKIWGGSSDCDDVPSGFCDDNCDGND